MSTPLDLSKFKKVRVEKDHTVLKHPDGHEIKVLHKPLNPKIMKQLDAVQMAEGGQVNVKLQQANKGGGEDMSALKKERYAQGYAKGGAVPVEDSAIPEGDRTAGFNRAHERGEKIIGSQLRHFDEGGKPDPSPSPSPAPPIDPDKAKSAQDSMRKAFNFADGGTPDNTHSNLSEALKNLSQKFVAPQQFNMTAPENLQQTPQQSPEAPSQPQESQPQAAPQDPSMAPPVGTLPQQAQADVEAQNKAESAGAQNVQQAKGAESDIYGQQAQGMQDLRSKFEDVGNQLHQKFEDLSNQVQTSKIDPHQWWDSKSTGSKILTAIGMMFGGAGTGLAGHPEMAGEAINKAVDRDIDSQKANLANKNTLLAKYLEMYNSLPQAEAAARLTMNAGVEGLINQQAAKLGSANAMNAAQMANSARRQALLPQMEGLARGQVMGQMYGGMDQKPGGGEQGPNSAEQSYQKRMQDMRILNPDLGKDMENKYLPGVGVSRVPVPDKLREDLTLRKDLSDKIAQLELFTKQHGGTLLDRSVVNEGKAMAAQVQDAFRSAHQQGVFKESEKNFVNSILSADPTSFFANIRTMPGYKKAREFNNQTVKQYYNSYGIKPFPDSQQPQSGEQSQTSTMNGVQYRKVDGGWQKVQ